MHKTLRTLGKFAFAALAALLISLAAPKPADAAPIATGAALIANSGTPALAEQVQYRRHHRSYRRHGHYRPVYRYRAPRYYGRRCWTQPRMVMTPWGWQRRHVRVCR
jgi:hypothetical protein